MSSTVAALAWNIRGSQSLEDGFSLDLLRCWQLTSDKVSDARTTLSEHQEPLQAVSDTDYDVAKNQVVKADLLEELPGEYTLRHPIPLDVHRAPHYFWVTAQNGFLQGIGNSPQAAIEDYGYALLDYYQTLQSERDNLAPHLVDHLETLEMIIVEK